MTPTPEAVPRPPLEPDTEKPNPELISHLDGMFLAVNHRSQQVHESDPEGTGPLCHVCLMDHTIHQSRGGLTTVSRMMQATEEFFDSLPPGGFAAATPASVGEFINAFEHLIAVWFVIGVYYREHQLLGTLHGPTADQLLGQILLQAGGETN